MAEPRSDAEIFRILEMFDAGMTGIKIATELRISRSAAIATKNRIDREHIPSKHDGTMPYGWRRDGLARQNGG